MAYGQVMYIESGKILYQDQSYEKDEIMSIMKNSQDGYLEYNRYLDKRSSAKSLAIIGGIITGGSALIMYSANRTKNSDRLLSGLEALFLYAISIPSLITGVTIATIGITNLEKADMHLNRSINEFNKEFGKISAVPEKKFLKISTTASGVGLTLLF